MGDEESSAGPRKVVRVLTAVDSTRRPAPQIAKLTIPKLRGAIPRERLFALLDQRGDRSLIWISGPPGAGKTTLAGSYLERSSRAVLWYRADGGDADLSTVFFHLREAALTLSRSASGLPLLSPEYLLDVPTFARNFFRSLFGLFAGAATLVVDNYQDAGEGMLDFVIKAAVAELPNHVNVLVLSRGAPPAPLATLQMQSALGTIDWEQLRLTSDEAQSIAAHAGIIDLDLVRSLYSRCDGWAAGLVLLLEYTKQVSAPRTQVVVHAKETLFNYFSSELFDAASAATQQLLLSTALMPSFSVSQAAQFASAEEAEQVLGWLYKRNFFMDCREGTERTYQYHALFREFLLARGKTFFSAQQRQELLLKAVHAFDGCGQTEVALTLAIDALAWNEATRLLRALAPNLLQQGRNAMLERWINAFPEPVLSQTPWLRYWLGAARLPFDPGGGRTAMEQAYAQFEKQGDEPACLLACSGILQSFFLEWGDLHPTDRWLEVFRKLIQKPDASWPADIQMQVLPCLTGIVLSHLGDPLLDWGNARAQELIDAATEPEQQLTMAHFVMTHFQMAGRWRQGAQLLQRVDELLARSTVSPLQTLLWSALKIAWYAMCSATCSESRGRAEINRFIELSETSGIRVLDSYGLGLGIYFALIWRDDALASQLLERMQTGRASHRALDVGHFNWLQAALALERGDLITASDSLHVSLEKALEGGARFALAQTRLLLAQLHQVQGNVAQALQEVEQTLDYARTASSLTFEHAGLLVKAYILLNSNQEQRGLVVLREGLQLGKNTGQSVIAPHALSRITSYLYSEALSRDIEAAYVRALIRCFNIPPASTDVPNWPWPIRIYTLGRFGVLRDDEPIKVSSKAQKKPLELLRALIALGGRAVDINDIMSILWPTEGPSARVSFDMALMRLRKLLGHPDAVALTDGKLTLDQQVCWVDAWTFQRALTRLDETEERTDAALLNLYRGRFLDRDGDAAWIVNTRDRLAAKFEHAVLHFGNLEERAERWEAAASIYRHALEQDNVHEEFYRGLMTCQHRLGQRAEAIKTYKRCRDLLSINLNIRPSAATEALYRRVLAG